MSLTCHECKEPTVFVLRCAKCKSAFYCGRACQIAAWPMHKLQCSSTRLISPSETPSYPPERCQRLASETNVYLKEWDVSTPRHSPGKDTSSVRCVQNGTQQKSFEEVAESSTLKQNNKQPLLDNYTNSSSDSAKINRNVNLQSESCVSITVKSNKLKHKLCIPAHFNGTEIMKLICSEIKIPEQSIKLIYKGKMVTRDNIDKFIKPKATFQAIGEPMESSENLDEDEIKILMRQMSVDRNRAIRALRQCETLVDAILLLVFGNTWSEWWSYDGISGPDFWGLVNDEWNVCANGLMQSPINIDPRVLLHDPQLRHVKVEKHRVSGLLVNTGQEIKIVIDSATENQREDESETGGNKEKKVTNNHFTSVKMSAGPFIYQFTIYEIIFHFGKEDGMGSEHSVNGRSFSGEIQLLGWNSQLYGNYTQAKSASYGLAMLGILVQIGDRPNNMFDMLTKDLMKVRYKGQQSRVRYLSVHDLMPETTDYVTYEGSLTQPGCQESVTWVVMNRPIYVTKHHLQLIREIMSGKEDNPRGAITGNHRPIQALHHRPLRTNINFPVAMHHSCTMRKEMIYQANEQLPGFS